MRKQLTICAGLLVLGIGGAQAQAIYASPGPFEPSAVLPPYEIMSIVRSTGLAPLTRPMRRGSYYVLVAVDRVGRQMRVVVDAQLGDIVNMRPAMAAGPFNSETTPLPDTTAASAAYGARAGADGNFNNGSSNPPRPLPSARTATASPALGGQNFSSASASSGAPNANASNAGSSSPVAPPRTGLAVAEPALPPPPPLPRPRPKLALNQAPAPAAPTPPAAAKPALAPAAAASQPASDAGQIE